MSYLTDQGTVPSWTVAPRTSPGNSWGYGSNVTLASGQTLTGIGELTPHRDVLVSAYVLGGTATLFVEFSIDGGDNYDTSISFAMASGAGEFHTIVKGSRTCRIRLTAGSDDLTIVRIHTEFGDFRQGNLPLNATIQADADASTVRTIDSLSDIALGRFQGFEGIHKFGHAPSGVQSAAAGADIWDRADASATQSIWTPPTQARVHAIVSSSANDDIDSGTGARSIRVWGLTAWDAAEVSEDIDLEGQTPVNTTNSYVILHRMRVLTNGGTGYPAGTITATAATDSTVTAVIRPNIGSTTMAIYGWPSGKTLLVDDWFASLFQAQSQARDARFRLYHSIDPENYPGLFNEISIRGLQSDGASDSSWNFMPPLSLPGPGILKINGVGSHDDLDVSAGFNGILVDDA